MKFVKHVHTAQQNNNKEENLMAKNPESSMHLTNTASFLNFSGLMFLAQSVATTSLLAENELTEKYFIPLIITSLLSYAVLLVGSFTILIGKTKIKKNPKEITSLTRILQRTSWVHLGYFSLTWTIGIALILFSANGMLHKTFWASIIGTVVFSIADVAIGFYYFKAVQGLDDYRTDVEESFRNDQDDEIGLSAGYTAGDLTLGDRMEEPI